MSRAHGPTAGVRPLVLGCLDYLALEPDVFVRVAAAAGFDGVTLRVAGSVVPVAADVSGRPERRGRVLAALAETGLFVQDVEVVRLAPNVSDATLESAVEIAAALGARHLLTVDSGPRAGGGAERLARAVDLAAAYGVRPVLEFMRFTAVRSLLEAVPICLETGAGVLVDALHLLRSGGSVDEVRAAVETHGAALIPYLQICDAPLAGPTDLDALRDEAVRDRWLPGTGSLPLCELLRAVPAGPVVVEAPVRELANSSAAQRAGAAFASARRVLETVDV